MGHLAVVISPDIADDNGSEASAPEGGSVELRCTATGEPAPTISWKRTLGRNIVFRNESGREEKGDVFIMIKMFFLVLMVSQNLSMILKFCDRPSDVMFLWDCHYWW